MAGDKKLLALLDSTLALSAQFTSSLSLSSLRDVGATPRTQADCHNPSNLPLPLLSAAAQKLKQDTGKASLFAINTPFTPSAIITVISQVNDSALPSLVTAVFLLDPSHYSKLFCDEIRSLVISALREYVTLINVIKKITQDDGKELKEEDKVAITTAAGRVWKVCDQLVASSTDGVVGMVIQKANQFLELIRDGIKELEGWDPADSEDDEWDVDDDADDTKHDTSEGGEEKRIDDELAATLLKEKKELLRLLVPISKFYVVMTTQRLKPLKQDEILPKYAPVIDSLVERLKRIPDLVDEAVGSLYEHDIEGVASFTKRLKDCAIFTAEMVRKPWKREDQLDSEAERLAETEDTFLKWVTIWLRVFNSLGKPSLN